MSTAHHLQRPVCQNRRSFSSSIKLGVLAKSIMRITLPTVSPDHKVLTLSDLSEFYDPLIFRCSAQRRISMDINGSLRECVCGCSHVSTVDNVRILGFEAFYSSFLHVRIRIGLDWIKLGTRDEVRVKDFEGADI